VAAENRPGSARHQRGCTRSDGYDGGAPSYLIRVAEALDGKPAVANHVVVITHQDQVGRWTGIQGQPRCCGEAGWW
jgi:hypothetical protein